MRVTRSAKRYSLEKKTTTPKSSILQTRKQIFPKRRIADKQLGKDGIDALIREQAYRFFEQRGYAHGSDVNDWLEAEKIITVAMAR